MMQERPRIGVGVVVEHKGKLLLGKRKSSIGAGDWGLPGGHLEFGETIEECATRELVEETGLKALSLRVGPWTAGLIDGKHYITFFVFATLFEGTCQVLEPEKCECWEWFSWDQLPEPLFSPIRSLQEQKKISAWQECDHGLGRLFTAILEFHKERDWDPFHSPKNLVMNLASEVGELVEPFRWLTELQSYKLDPKALEGVCDEIGDVFSCLLYLAHKLGVDPIRASHQKLEKLGRKYPVDLCRGKAFKGLSE